MNRRRFLQMLSSGAFGAMTLDVDKLLWVPGQKTIFLPTRKTILTIDGIHPEALRLLKEGMASVAHTLDHKFVRLMLEADFGLGG